MKLLSSKEIKKILFGIIASDGSIDSKGRFDFYSKQEEYAKYVYEVVNQITGTEPKFYVKKDKRGYIGYRVTNKNHPYMKKLREIFYDARKELNHYSVSRFDALSLAHIWMCDGYLEHAKNRKIGKVQNVGWFCLEAFPKDELELLKSHLSSSYGIESSFVKKPWGFGYRLRVGGVNLQKFISLVYPHILDVFKYKTPLFYKGKEFADMSLPSAEQYIHSYENIEDIVRHLQIMKEN